MDTRNGQENADLYVIIIRKFLFHFEMSVLRHLGLMLIWLGEVMVLSPLGRLVTSHYGRNHSLTID